MSGKRPPRPRGSPSGRGGGPKKPKLNNRGGNQTSGRGPNPQPRQAGPNPDLSKAQASVWEKEVERVGFEYAEHATEWARVMSVIEMVAKHNGYGEDAYIELLSPMNRTEMQRKTPEKLGWDIKSVMTFSLLNGTVGVQHNNMKLEYNRVKAKSDAKLAKGEVTRRLKPMSIWRHPQESWQRGAAYVTGYWKCNPELTKEQAYREAVQKAETSFKHVKSGKRLIQEIMTGRRLRLSHEQLDNVIMRATRVPNPKWPNDRAKDTKFLCCRSEKDQETAEVVIFEFFTARNIAHQQTAADGTPLEGIPAFRRWATIDGKASHKDDEPRFTSDVIAVWRKFLAIEECAKLPSKKISKEKQKEMSYGHPADGHTDYIGPDQRFESEEQMVAFLKEKKFFKFIRFSRAFKAYRFRKAMELLYPDGSMPETRHKPITDVLPVAPLQDDEGNLTYRWKIPNERGHSLAESIVGRRLPDLRKYDIEATGLDVFAEIERKYHATCHHLPSYKNMHGCQKACEATLKKFDFDPLTYRENINKRGLSWRFAHGAILEYAGIYYRIEKYVKTMDQQMEKNEKRHPQLVPTGTDFFFLPAGCQFVKGKNYLVGQLMGFVFRMHGHTDNWPTVPGFERDDIKNVHEAMLAFDLHFPEMGETDAHYNEGLKMWLSKAFWDPFDTAMEDLLYIGALYHEYHDKANLTEERDETLKEFIKAVDYQLKVTSEKKVATYLKSKLRFLGEEYFKRDVTNDENPNGDALATGSSTDSDALPADALPSPNRPTEDAGTIVNSVTPTQNTNVDNHHRAQ